MNGFRFRQLLQANICAAALFAALPAAAQTVSVRLDYDPDSLNNVEAFTAVAGNVLNSYLLERLVYFDAEGKPQPWLAEGWTVSDDQKQITFKLRPGITFHDGTEFNADAVVKQFQAIMDPERASPHRANMGPLEKIEATGPLEVVFTYGAPFAPAFTALAFNGAGINSPTAVEAAGKDYARHPVGTGPYVFESWVPGTSITLVRNDKYHPQYRTDALNKDAPFAEKIELNVITEEGVAQAALETGELSVAGLQADTIAQFIDNPDFKTFVNKASGALMFIEFNQHTKPMDELNVRKAIGYAIDRDAIVAAAYGGYGEAVLAPLSPTIPGYDAKVGQEFGTPYDPEKSKALLAEAGWTDSDGDGLLDKDGKKAEFALLSFSGKTQIDRSLQVIQSNLADVGIKVDITTSEPATFYPSLLNEGWAMDLMTWGSNDADLLKQLFMGEGHRKKLTPVPDLDKTLEQCSSDMDVATRMTCVSEAQKLLLKNMTIVPISISYPVFASQSNIEGFHFDYMGFVIPGDIKID